jgi:hypothetical protein
MRVFRKLSLVLTLLFAFVLPASASDEVHFLQNIQISEDSTIHDVVCFLCSVEAKGDVQGDIVVFGGSLQLKGNAHRDVVVFAGNVNMGAEATIGRDLVIFGGQLNAGSHAMINGDRVIFPAWIFLFIFLVLFAMVWGVYLLIRWLVDRGRPAYSPRR